MDQFNKVILTTIFLVLLVEMNWLVTKTPYNTLPFFLPNVMDSSNATMLSCNFWCFFHKAWVAKLNPIAPHGSQIINGLDWSEFLDTQGA
jgi:hypothetical protein